LLLDLLLLVRYPCTADVVHSTAAPAIYPAACCPVLLLPGGVLPNIHSSLLPAKTKAKVGSVSQEF
jgi:hypothetical protein